MSYIYIQYRTYILRYTHKIYILRIHEAINYIKILNKIVERKTMIKL